MPDLIIKPAAQSGNKVIIQDQAGGAVITTADSGATITSATLTSPTINTPTIATPTITGAATFSGDLVPSTPLSHRNLVINGGMQVWQRATGATGAGNAYNTVDRYQFMQNTDGNYTSEKHPMSLADINTTGHATALALVCSVADTSIAAGQYAYIRHVIEAQNCQHLQWGTANAKTITLSFWVKSSLTGIYTVGMEKQDTTAYLYKKEYTINSANTWEKKTITISPTAGSTSLITGAGGIINNDNGAGLVLAFGLAWGSNYHGTNDSWATTGWSTSNQVKWMNSTSNNLYIAGVQLELGSNATPFEHRSFADELARCQRYYFQDDGHLQGAGYQNDYYHMDVTVPIPVPMRAQPTTTTTGGYIWRHNGYVSAGTNPPIAVQYWETYANNLYLKVSGVGWDSNSNGYVCVGYFNDLFVSAEL